MKTNRILKSVTAILLALTLIASAALAEGVQVFHIATEGAYAPFNYVDAQGNPDGYDIAVAKAVDELLDDVEFDYVAVEWSSIFAGLEAGRYDLIVSQAAKTPEREEKYIFGDVAYSWSSIAIAYQTGRDDIKTMTDLEGKTLSVAVGSSNANFAETWNAENGNIINLVYGDGEISKALLDVQEGRVDATLVSPQTAYQVIGEQGLDVEFVVLPIEEREPAPVFWLFSNTEANEELKVKTDAALQELIDSGKLAEISIEYLGGDYSTLEAFIAAE